MQCSVRQGPWREAAEGVGAEAAGGAHGGDGGEDAAGDVGEAKGGGGEGDDRLQGATAGGIGNVNPPPPPGPFDC